MAYGTLRADLIENTNGLTGNAIGPGFKNRIINGDMRIDQRNAGAAVTLDGNELYPVDRFPCGDVTDGAFTAQQDTSAPAGFVNSIKCTITTADASLSATQVAYCGQRIEGTNLSDLGWGTASAKTVTLSFWVRSSLTGTFGGALRNSATTRSYPFSYIISVANTWEQKSITIPGDTTGTWLTTTGVGLDLYFSLGAGSSRTGTAGSWAAANYLGATGQTQVIGTLNATWYVTGVQLEVGPSASSFDYRPYGTELTLCQRYCLRYGPSLNYGLMRANGQYTTGGFIYFPNPMRATPSLTAPASSNFSGLETANSGPSIIGGDEKYTNIQIGYANSTTTGAVYLFSGGASAYLLFTSEL